MKYYLVTLILASLLAFPGGVLADSMLWNGTKVGMSEAELYALLPCKPSVMIDGDQVVIGKSPTLIFGQSFFTTFNFRNHHLYKVSLQSDAFSAPATTRNLQLTYQNVTDELTKKYGRPVNFNDSAGGGIRVVETDFLNNGLSVRATWIDVVASIASSSISITYESSAGGPNPL
jgi:hypothetical protein